ncbi:hypothetical protein K3495_g311 [Podosphaera aphanis]|nr:hypothetical protein K3495_g311 [Podosphaera aphanis]
MAKSKTKSKPVKVPADPELAAIREQQILPAVQHLQSPDLKIRSSAAQSIQKLVKQTKTRKLLLREQIVKLLLEQFLVDTSLEIRACGWSILSSLAQHEDSDFCVYLFRQNILNGLKTVIEMIIQTIESLDPPVSKLPQIQLDLLWRLTTSVVNLLTSLSESQDEILKSISDLPSVLNFLFGLLSLESTPPQVQTEILLCLIALTEDNKLIVQQIVDSKDWFGILIRIKDSAQINVVPACGVLHNVFETLQWFDYNTPIEGTSDAMLIPVLVQFMKGSLSENAKSYPHSDLDKFLQLAFEVIASISTSTIEALEQRKHMEKDFPRATTDTDGDPEKSDMEMDIDEDASMNEDEIDADMDMVTGDASDEDGLPTDELTLDRLISVAVPAILEIFRSKGEARDVLIGHALASLNNIAWTISSIDFSSKHLVGLQKVWASLSQEIWNDVISPVLESNTADIELASMITSLAWAVSLSVKGKIKLLPNEHRKFMALYQASRDLEQSTSQKVTKSEKEVDPFQGLGVKCVGVLGNLALEPSSIELNREIGNFLGTLLSSVPDIPPADMVEVLNQIYDIYSDASYTYDEPNYWGGNIHRILEDTQAKVKKMTKAIDKRKFPELRTRADEAVFNLGRFLAYKRKEKTASNTNGK